MSTIERKKGLKLVKFEDLPDVKHKGRSITREMVGENPDILKAIQNVYGINVDMTLPADSDSA